MPERGEFIVLLYHGVHENSLPMGARNSSGKHISESRFEEDMNWLAQNKTLVTMSDIGAALTGGTQLPNDAVAVTFDDGFLNNYAVAWPILEKYQIPATFYLATGFIGTGRMAWSDLLEDAILGTDQSSIRICIESDRSEWPLQSESQKISAYAEIKRICKKLPDEVKNKVISNVKSSLNFSPSNCHHLNKFIDWDQVREMDQSNLIDFGAHTVDHVVLSKVPESKMCEQIDQSMAALTDELDRPCMHFSYPEGQIGDFDKPVIDHLRHIGIGFCPSAIDGINQIGATDPYFIKRIMVGFEGREFPFELGNA